MLTHAKVTHAIYEITSCHDYKILNVIHEILMTTITSSHVYISTQRTSLTHILGCHGDSNQ
jgi:hypothetical protein